jgi:hypothetical protein
MVLTFFGAAAVLLFFLFRQRGRQRRAVESREVRGFNANETKGIKATALLRGVKPVAICVLELTSRASGLDQLMFDVLPFAAIMNLERLTKCLWRRCAGLLYRSYCLRRRAWPETATLTLRSFCQALLVY